jgi:hypothetical protein
MMTTETTETPTPTTPETPRTKRTLRWLTGRGDDRLEWDSANPEELRSARAQFLLLRERGFAFFAIGPGGARAEQVTDFDPTEEELLAVPPVAGGTGETEGRGRT